MSLTRKILILTVSISYNNIINIIEQSNIDQICWEIIILGVEYEVERECLKKTWDMDVSLNIIYVT